MEKKALILIDYTHDFVAADGRLTVGQPGQDLEQTICNKLSQTIEQEGMVFAVNDLHQEHDLHHPEHALFPPHNLAGSDGRKLYGSVEDRMILLENRFPGQVVRLDKRRYSAFCGTPLAQILRQENINHIELAGVCTDICVLHTAVDAYNMGFKVTVDEGAVASFNQTAHAVALQHFQTVMGFQVMRRG